MDYPRRRNQFYEKFVQFCREIVLNDEFIKPLKQYFNEALSKIESASIEEMKCFILLELTKNRNSCNKVIEFLRVSNNPANIAIANVMETINTSPGRFEYFDEVDIEVIKVDEQNIKKPDTGVYPMTKSPRGKAIIINNVQDMVQLESYRFAHIFTKLKYEVEINYDLTANEIKEKLESIRDYYMDNDIIPQSIVVIVNSHGGNGFIAGKNAINESDNSDCIAVSQLINIFGPFMDTIKMFFFTFCRHYSSPIVDLRDVGIAQDVTDTVVYHSSSDGYPTYGEDDKKYTPFGRYLSESLAQYAHMLSLTDIINRTNQKLRSIYPNVGEYLPETRLSALTHDVFFNPDWSE